MPAAFRASGALQLMIYRKMLRMRVTSEQVLGKMVNICMNDMERLFDAFTTGPLVFCAYKDSMRTVCVRHMYATFPHSKSPGLYHSAVD